MAGYSYHEQADMIFTYGCANGNEHKAARLYQIAFSDQGQMNDPTFTAVDRQIAEKAPQSMNQVSQRSTYMPESEEHILQAVGS